MSILTEAEKERIYDMERSGQIYVVAPVADEQLAVAPVIRIMPDGTPNKYDTGEWSFERTKEITPLGALSNGVLVQGLHDVDGSAHCVRIETADGSVYAGDDGVFSVLWAEHDLELTIEQVQALRRLFAGDALEQLMAIAVVWERDQPLPPIAPAVTTQRYALDASDAEYYSFAPGTEYHCGDVFIEVSDDPDEDPNVYGVGGDCISLVKAAQAVQAFQTLLNDSGVQAALARHEAGASLKQAA